MAKAKIARTKRGTKQALKRAETPLPADATPRAAERAGIPALLPKPDPYKEATRHVINVVGEGLVKACDQLGEEIAAIEGSGCGDSSNVVDALLTLWKLRWELGMTPDAVEATAKADDYALGQVNAAAKREQAKQAAAEGGAS